MSEQNAGANDESNLFMRFILCAVLAALTAFPFALSAQITPISPFLGTHQENWDDYQLGPQTTYSNPNLVAFDGIATFDNPYLSIYRKTTSFNEAGGFGLREYMASTQSGQLGLGKGAESSTPVTIRFAVPVHAFGGYWAALSGFSPNQSHPVGFRFLESNGDLVGADSFVYFGPNRDGTLEWAGWSFSRPVSQIEYAAWYVVNDSLRVTVIPEPNTPTLLLLGSAACLFLSFKTNAVRALHTSLPNGKRRT